MDILESKIRSASVRFLIGYIKTITSSQEIVRHELQS